MSQEVRERRRRKEIENIELECLQYWRWLGCIRSGGLIGCNPWPRRLDSDVLPYVTLHVHHNNELVLRHCIDASLPYSLYLVYYCLYSLILLLTTHMDNCSFQFLYTQPLSGTYVDLDPQPPPIQTCIPVVGQGKHSDWRPGLDQIVIDTLQYFLNPVSAVRFCQAVAAPPPLGLSCTPMDLLPPTASP